MIEKNDWRLQEQQDYLMNSKLHFIEFKPYSQEWDHEHCEFCGEKFGQNEGELKEGYCTTPENEKESRWICPNCYRDFCDLFRWVIENK